MVTKPSPAEQVTPGAPWRIRMTDELKAKFNEAAAAGGVERFLPARLAVGVRARVPYNIKRSGENAYNISVAVAGFAGADLSIEVKENTLTICGNKQSSAEEESDLIYQGIAERNFERNFQLAEHVQIKGASLENGLLQVDLMRVVPEAMKPRAIPITTAKKVILEGKAAKIAA